MKKGIKIFFGLFILGLIILSVNEVKKWNNDDFKMAVVGEDGIMIRSVSWQRGMVNELWIEGKVPVWIPRGMGWYQSDKIGKLLNQENKWYLAGEVMFYNFGFVPDMVALGNDQNWFSNTGMISDWGVINYLRYMLTKSKMMVKREIINTDLSKSADFLKEIIPRDFADSRLLTEDLRLTIYNVGQSQGLANFLSRILEWSGFSVIGVDNYSGEVKNCLVGYGQAADNTYGFKILQKEFADCQFQKNPDLEGMGVELYFGDSYSQMLNYPSYNNN